MSAHKRGIQLSIGSKIGLSFLIVVLVGTLISTIVGIRLIGNSVIEQAQNKVQHDLSVAWMAYNNKLENIKSIVQLTSTRFFIRDGILGEDFSLLRRELEKIRKASDFDVFTLTDESGVVILRTTAPYTIGDDQSNDDLVSRALTGKPAASTHIVTRDQLILEGEGLQERAFMEFIPTSMAKKRGVQVETSGMMLKAASPVMDREGRIIGVLYGGVLINRNYDIVDQIKEIVYKGERYRGKDIGTATIFQWDLRISTNVRNREGMRAIGTRVSETVYDHVLENESAWFDRAFVVNDWYVTAYEPVKNINGDTIGILYVGMLEQPYADMKKRVVKSMILYSFLLSIGVALVAALILGRRISRPIVKLAHVSEMMADGHFNHERVAHTGDEIGKLADSFSRMSKELARTLAEKDDANNRLKDLNVRYLELLGFASHELMQPVGVIKGYLKLMQLSPEGSLEKSHQKDAVSAMLRNVNSIVTMSGMYLNLARIENGALEVNPEKIRIYHDIVEPIIRDMDQRLRQKNMTIEVDDRELFDTAEVHGDPTLIRIVFTNLLTNACKYGRENGNIRCGVRKNGSEYIFNVNNEGNGLSSDKLQSVFEKFVRLESGGMRPRGTGLGLFITREIVELHSGKIWAESEQGKWVNFLFTLPQPGTDDILENAGIESG